MEIRDSRLYRQQFPTFEAYCRERWGLSRFYAHRIIDAAEVANNLLPIGNIPQTESQARPLTRLEPEVQKEVWRDVVKTTPAEQITAKVVEEKAKAAEVVKNLGCTIVQPATESQARPLTRLEPEVQKEVWQAVVETTPADRLETPKFKIILIIRNYHGYKCRLLDTVLSNAIGIQ